MFGCCDQGGATNAYGFGGLGDATKGDNSGGVQMWPPGGPVPTRTGQDLAACLAYVAKYRAKMGRDPVGVWCVGQSAPPVILPPPPPVVIAGPRCSPGFTPYNGRCVPVPPVVTALPTPAPAPISTSPVHHRWAWKRRPPPVKRPHVERPKPHVALAPVEICPIRGYTSRLIPEANEYQNFKCTPGQPVTIDTGLQAAGRADAMARHGLSGLDGDVTIGSVTVPMWVAIAGVAAVGMFLMKHRR